MTYYEWINYFYSLQKAPISDDAINIINNSQINYKGNIKIRYLNHIVKLINIRLNNALDNFLSKSQTIIQDKNTLNIELNDLKKEKFHNKEQVEELKSLGCELILGKEVINIDNCLTLFAKKLASIKHFETDVTNQLLKSIQEFGNEMNKAIKNSFSDCNNNEIIMLINNIDFNT